jgi:hypothetical protein
MDHRETAAYSTLRVYKVPGEYGSWPLQHHAVSTCGQLVPHAGVGSAMPPPVRGQARRSRPGPTARGLPFFIFAKVQQSNHGIAEQFGAARAGRYLRKESREPNVEVWYSN